MGLKSKQPSVPERQQIAYTPPSYNMDPFGRIDYAGGVYTYSPGAAERTGITTRQSLINQLLPEVGRTGAERAGQIEQYGSEFTSRLMDEALPYYKGMYTSRGLENSTAEAKGYAKLTAEGAQRGIFAREDLYAQDRATTLAELAALEQGLQQAYTRGSGIASQEQNYASQYFDIAKKNNDIAWENQINQYNRAMQDYMDKVSTWATVGELGGTMLAGPVGGMAGLAAGGYLAGGKQGAYKSFASKTGSKNKF